MVEIKMPSCNKKVAKRVSFSTHADSGEVIYIHAGKLSFFTPSFFFFFDSCYKNAKKPDIKMSKKHNLKFCTCFIHKKQTLKIKRSFFVFLRPYEVCEQVFMCARVLCVDLRASATVHGSDEHHSQSVRAFLRVLILYSFSSLQRG